MPTHAEAKDILAGAMLRYARAQTEQGPGAEPLQGRSELPTISLVGEIFPVDAIMIGKLLEPLGFDLREAANGQEAVDIWEQ